MSKEKILDEYRKKFGLCDGSLKYCGCKKELDFISKAINQTREETIRDVEEVLPEENYGDEDNCSTEYKNGWNDCREEIKQSLINLMSK